MKSYNWMFHQVGQLQIDFNQFPLAQFALNFYNQHSLSSIFFTTQIFQSEAKQEEFQSKPIKEQENHVSDLNNDLTMQNSVKVEEKVHPSIETQKTKNSQFKYFDPRQAPYLTFGIDDIYVISKNQDLYANKINKNCLQNKQCQKSYNNSTPQSQDCFSIIDFLVKQPDPKLSPFLIIKKRPIIKKKSLTTQEFEKRAHLIEIKRIKNLKRMEVEERIGKKLPVKNKKWKRKKPSLVFNSQQYKKRLMSSKKYKDSREDYNKLFFPSS